MPTVTESGAPRGVEDCWRFSRSRGSLLASDPVANLRTCEPSTRASIPSTPPPCRTWVMPCLRSSPTESCVRNSTRFPCCRCRRRSKAATVGCWSDCSRSTPTQPTPTSGATGPGRRVRFRAASRSLWRSWAGRSDARPSWPTPSRPCPTSSASIRTGPVGRQPALHPGAHLDAGRVLVPPDPRRGRVARGRGRRRLPRCRGRRGGRRPGRGPGCPGRRARRARRDDRDVQAHRRAMRPGVLLQDASAVPVRLHRRRLHRCRRVRRASAVVPRRGRGAEHRHPVDAAPARPAAPTRRAERGARGDDRLHARPASPAASPGGAGGSQGVRGDLVGAGAGRRLQCQPERHPEVQEPAPERSAAAPRPPATASRLRAFQRTQRSGRSVPRRSRARPTTAASGSTAAAPSTTPTATSS